MALEDVGMRLAVTSAHLQLPGPLLGLDDRCNRVERDDPDNLLADLVRSGHSKLQVVRILEFW